MEFPKDLYKGSLALLTDLYQLTMAHGYWKNKKSERNAIFNLFFRTNPFDGGYTLTSGLEQILYYLDSFRFAKDDLDYLSTLKGKSGDRLFPDEFLKYLEEMRFSCDVYGMPEGTLAFPHEPVLKVKGPLLQCQILETPLLNLFNFSTLIATKAARITQEAGGAPVLEFGLRRAQGTDGGLTASRAAYVGGCSSTSNVLAGKLYGIPVSGTHAHSWIMSFDSELAAFSAYAQAYPNDSIFLVDTYDTLEGVRHAISVAQTMKKEGKSLQGIRLDSGDLAYFSKKARKMLDEAGLEEVKIVASNDLDEHILNSLHSQNAKIDLWGIGTKLATAYDQPALGGVYKLAAIEDDDGSWKPTIKLSEQAIKVNNPGDLQVRRIIQDGLFWADVIYDLHKALPEKTTMVDPMDNTRRKKLDFNEQASHELLVPLFEKGKRSYKAPSLGEVRSHAQAQLNALDEAVKRLVNPHIYAVGLEKKLHEEKTALMLKLRKVYEE